MKLLFIVVGAAVVVAAIAVALGVRRFKMATTAERSDRASIMDPEPERMSLFSADHVRMLSEAQLRALDPGDGNEP